MDFYEPETWTKIDCNCLYCKIKHWLLIIFFIAGIITFMSINEVEEFFNKKKMN